MNIDRYHYDEVFLGPPDDDDEFPDVTDPDEQEPAPKQWARRQEGHRTVYEEDYLYDPLSRQGWD